MANLVFKTKYRFFFQKNSVFPVRLLVDNLSPHSVGIVWVGEEEKETVKGMAILVPAGHPHRIVNSGAGRMVLLVGIAPSNAD